MEFTLDKPTALPEFIVHAVRPHFDSLFNPKAQYRGSGVFLTDLEPDALQPDLFGGHVRVERLEKIHQSLDEITKKYGKHVVYLGSSFLAIKRGLHEGVRGTPAERQHELSGTERKRRIINLPFLGDVN